MGRFCLQIIMADFKETSHGGTVTLTMKDQDAAVIDLTGYTELELYFRRPDYSEWTRATGDGVADSGDPTDGEIIYTFADTELANYDGTWKVVGRVTFASAEHESDPESFTVARRFKG